MVLKHHALYFIDTWRSISLSPVMAARVICFIIIQFGYFQFLCFSFNFLYELNICHWYHSARIKHHDHVKHPCVFVTVGPIKIDRSDTTVLKQEESIPIVLPVQPGGAGRPTTCAARHKVAILVPYRNRSPQLGIFIRHMHPILLRQLVDYRVFLIQQVTLFNTLHQSKSVVPVSVIKGRVK